MRMNFIDEKDIAELREISKIHGEKTINTTVIIHNFITSICENSTPQTGIMLSEEDNQMLKDIKTFNRRTIYKNPKFDVYRKYAALVIRSIYETLAKFFDYDNTINKLSEMKDTYPKLISEFSAYLNSYCSIDDKNVRYQNKKIYGKLETDIIYKQAIIDYISGMTDRYAIEIFNELIRF